MAVRLSDGPFKVNYEFLYKSLNKGIRWTLSIDSDHETCTTVQMVFYRA